MSEKEESSLKVELEVDERKFFQGKKFIGAGLQKDRNVLNVLRILIEDPRNITYIQDYERAGKLASDPRVIHPPFDRTLKILGYISHEARFNFSVRCLKDVKVLPENGGPPIDKKIWRTYNIILDGELHVPKLYTVLSKESFVGLQDARVITEKDFFHANKAYTINLEGMNLTSRFWTNPKVLGFVSLLKEEKNLEAEQTALGKRLEEIGACLIDIPQSQGSNIYAEHPVEVSDVPFSSYSAKCVEVRLLKYKAPEYDYSTAMFDHVKLRLKKVRQRLVVVRFLVRAITFSMEICNSKFIPWDKEEVVERGKYAKLEQAAVFEQAHLKKVSWGETFNRSQNKS